MPQKYRIAYMHRKSSAKYKFIRTNDSISNALIYSAYPIATSCIHTTG